MVLVYVSGSEEPVLSPDYAQLSVGFKRVVTTTGGERELEKNPLWIPRTATG